MNLKRENTKLLPIYTELPVYFVHNAKTHTHTTYPCYKFVAYLNL